MSLNIHNHRGENDCPFCGFDQEGIEWLRTKTETLGCNKPNKIIVFSCCPECGELSWRHYDDIFTPKILDIMNIEIGVIQ